MARKISNTKVTKDTKIGGKEDRILLPPTFVTFVPFVVQFLPAWLQ